MKRTIPSEILKHPSRPSPRKSKVAAYNDPLVDTQRSPRIETPGLPSALQQAPSWEHKLAFTLPEVMAIASVSNGALYKAIGDGQLRAVKRGRRTLVLRADLDAWLNTFPAIQPKQPAA